jgi:hypothetical protein
LPSSVAVAWFVISIPKVKFTNKWYVTLYFLKRKPELANAVSWYFEELQIFSNFHCPLLIQYNSKGSEILLGNSQFTYWKGTKWLFVN